MMKSLLYRLPDDLQEPIWGQSVARTFILLPEMVQRSHAVYYDSFDWRLYQKSLMLVGDTQSLTLTDLTADEVSPVQIIWKQRPLQQRPSAQRPTFAWDLPDGSLKEQLLPLLEVRALLPQATITIHSTPYRVLNEDEKTVARLVVETIRPSTHDAPPLTTTAHLLPVRGYEAETEQIADWLAEIGATAVSPLTLYEQILTAVGKEPGSYSAKSRLSLDPSMPAVPALKILMHAELEIIQTNAPYISQDIDTEFLHDFRVALRRTRSAISQFKDVLPPDIVTRFRTDLKTVAQCTNELRDLDVYLLAEPAYRAMLPDLMQDTITPLFTYLRRKRKKALVTAVTTLHSPAYQQIIEDWETFLHTANSHESSPAMLPLAQERIYKRYRRIFNRGQKILLSGSEPEMHALRIECKKLRYLLEFFFTLFPLEEMTILVNQLKVLQANLGDINDLHVQEAYLLRLADELPLPESRPALLAVGALVAHLYQQRAQAREQFSVAFTQFATQQNQRLFKQLFKQRET